MSESTKSEGFKYIKLKTGEDIICRLKKSNREDNNKIKIKQPVKILSGVKKGYAYESITLQQWIHFTNDEEFSIPKNSVLTMASMSNEMINFYNTYLMKCNIQKKYRKIAESMESPQKIGDSEKCIENEIVEDPAHLLELINDLGDKKIVH